MKSFKQFLKAKVAPALIAVAPVHGAHSKSKPPVLIPVPPIHGAHSKPKSLKEKYISPTTVKTHEWDEDHSANEHLGRDEHSITKKLNMDSEKFNKHPGSKHIVGYTENSSRVNRILLHESQGTHHGEYKHESDEAKIKGVDTALHHSKMEHDVHVYHGANFNPHELAKKHPERHIKSPCYLSATHDKQTARMFSVHNVMGKRHILHIHVKKGQHAMFIGTHSEHPHEHETLIPRGTTLKVHHEPTVLSDGTRVWHSHIVHQETHNHD